MSGAFMKQLEQLKKQQEQLKKQQEELEKRIQEQEERKKKLNNDASIERLEALVEPITEYLDNEQRIIDRSRQQFFADGYHSGDDLEQENEITNIRKFLKKFEEEEEDEDKRIKERRSSSILQNLHESEEDEEDFIDMARDELMKEEIYITLIGILKKQDERIKILEELVSQKKHDERIKKLEELVSQHWFHIHENVHVRHT
jgi:hypothetical protein